MADDLPALRLRQLGPYRHPFAHNAIRQNPEKRAWCGALNFFSAQARSFFPADALLPVAFLAMLFEQNSSRSDCLGLVFQRVRLAPIFFGRFAEFRVIPVGVRLRTGRWLLPVRCPPGAGK